MSGNSNGGGGGHNHRGGGNNKGQRVNHNGNHHNNTTQVQPQPRRGLVAHQQHSNRSYSPTTLSNASSSRKSSNSLGNDSSHHLNKQQPPATVTISNNSNSNAGQPLRRQQSLSSASVAATTTTTNSPGMNNTVAPTQNYKKIDLLRALAEVEGGSFQVTWRECFWIFVALAFLAMCSIAVGIAAGMTISIHYYGQEIRVLPKQKATMLDPAIALTNVVTKSQIMMMTKIANRKSANQTNPIHPNLILDASASLDLVRVLTTSETGQRDMLTVVEELPPLPHDDDDDETNQNQEDNNGASPKLPSEMSSQLPPHYNPSLPPIRSLLNYSKPMVLPKLCRDGETWGFDDWHTLQKAIQEANALSAERFMKWNEFATRYPNHPYLSPLSSLSPRPLASSSDIHDNDDNDDDDLSFWYYQDEVIFTICPGATLLAPKHSPPIFFNAEHVRLVCPPPPADCFHRNHHNYDCVLVKRGTHLSFGRHAHDVWIQGITFMQSAKSRRRTIKKVPSLSSSSLSYARMIFWGRGRGGASVTFYQDGAHASFLDCVWLDYHPTSSSSSISGGNSNQPYSSWFSPTTTISPPTSSSTTKSSQQQQHVEPPIWGAVADVNSSSTINFCRCFIGHQEVTSSSWSNGPPRSTHVTPSLMIRV